MDGRLGGGSRRRRFERLIIVINFMHAHARSGGDIFNIGKTEAVWAASKVEDSMEDAVE